VYVKILPLTHQNSPRKRPILPVLLGLDAFVTGGLAALLTVNRLLQKTANAYAPYDMDAASTVLDLMDKLLAYLFPCSVLLLFLVLITIAIGVWLKARSRTVRYAVTALVLVALLLSATGIGIWTLKASAMPSVLPMTPAPTPAQGISFRLQAPIYRAPLDGWTE
jgi:heme A synthase